MLEFHPILALASLALVAIAALVALFELIGGEGRGRTDP